MITKYKLFEIFDASNIYEYQLVSKKNSSDDEGKYILYLYKFTGKDSVNYYVRLWYFYKLKNPRNQKTYISLDFMDEEQYGKEKNRLFDINFKNTQKQDAIKTINTVFNILVENQKQNEPWTICFDCFSDRYKTYLYCVKKYLGDNYMRLDFCNEEENKCYFYLYNEKYYYMSEDETKLIRKDNDIVVYDSEDDN